jgi:hypothetical protein
VAPTYVSAVRSAASPTLVSVVSASRRAVAAWRAAAVCVRAVAREALRLAVVVFRLAAFCLRDAALRVPCVLRCAAVRVEPLRGVERDVLRAEVDRDLLREVERLEVLRRLVVF